jgi:hypothetical protein
MTGGEFSQLVDTLYAEQQQQQLARRRTAPPAPPSRRQASGPGVFEMLQNSRASFGRAFAKAISSQLAEASASIASMKLRGLKTGMGVKCIGRPGYFQVTDLDPERGRVAVRMVQDNPRWPVGVNFDDAVPAWIEANACERAPEFDAPDVDAPGNTMAKALGAAADRRTREQIIAEARAKGRALAIRTRQNLEEGLTSGRLSPAQVRHGENLLNAWCAKMGL